MYTPKSDSVAENLFIMVMHLERVGGIYFLICQTISQAPKVSSYA